MLEKRPNVKPVATGAFGGKMSMLGKTTDARDMGKVSAWAEELGKKFSI